MMLNWSEYRKQLAAGVKDIGQLSPDTIKGYVTLSTAGQKTDLLKFANSSRWEWLSACVATAALPSTPKLRSSRGRLRKRLRRPWVLPRPSTRVRPLSTPLESWMPSRNIREPSDRAPSKRQATCSAESSPPGTRCIAPLYLAPVDGCVAWRSDMARSPRWRDLSAPALRRDFDNSGLPTQYPGCSADNSRRWLSVWSGDWYRVQPRSWLWRWRGDAGSTRRDDYASNATGLSSAGSRSGDVSRSVAPWTVVLR